MRTPYLFLRTAALGLAMVTALLLSGVSADAAGDADIGWQVQPEAEKPGSRPYFVYDVEPGQVIEDTVVIGNLGSDTLPLTMVATDGLNASDGRFDLLETAATPDDIGTWVQLETDQEGKAGQAVIPPGEERRVGFTITVPENATPGDHVGGIVSSLVTQEKDEEGRMAQLDSRVAARVYLFVEGELDPQLEVSDVQTDYAGSFLNPFSGSATVSWTVRNPGNIRLAGEQVVSIGGFAGWGATETTVELPEVLPGNEIRQTVKIDDVPSAIRLGTTVEVQPEDPNKRVADPIEPAAASTTIWAMPWLLVLVLVVAAAVFWLLMRRQRRHRAEVASLRAELEQQQEPAATPESTG